MAKAPSSFHLFPTLKRGAMYSLELNSPARSGMAFVLSKGKISN